MTFSIQSLFKYLIKYNLSENAPLFFIYQNIPDNLFNSIYIKKIFSQIQDICIKHLYSLYEYLEIILLPYFLNQVSESYSNKISQYTIEHLNMLFNKNEFKEKINIQKIELIEAIRKFICRFLVSSDESEVMDGEENLILLLCNHELWDFLKNDNDKYLKIKDSLININKLLVEPILVKNTLNLFDILLGNESISDNNQRSKQYLNHISNINISVDKKFATLSYDIVIEKTKISKNAESIVDFIKKPERIIEFKDLTQIKLTKYRDIDQDKQTLYSLCKFEDNKIIAVYRDNILRVFSYDKNTFRKEPKFKEIEIENIKKEEDTNHVNCIKVLQDNSIVLLCTKPKIIILSIINNVAKTIQILDGSSYNCQQFYNAIEFDYDKLITSTNSNIIIWGKNSDNNYSYKNVISTGSDTNIVYINQDLFAAHVNDNTIRFYNREFKETEPKISNVTSRIEPLMMTMLNEELLGVCGSGNGLIYLIDIYKRKVVKEVKFDKYPSDHFSISKLLDSSIVINNSGGKCIHVKLIKEGINYNMKVIGELGGLCADTFAFEYLFDEIFIHSCTWGDIHCYMNTKIKDFYDVNNDNNNSQQEENIVIDEDIKKEIEKEIELKQNNKFSLEKLLPQVNLIKDKINFVTNILILKDGRLAASTNEGSIIIYNENDFSVQCKIKEHSSDIRYFIQIINNNLISCSSDNTIKIYKLNSQTSYNTIQTLNGHSSTVTKIIEYNENNLISCSDDHNIKIWNYNQSNQNYNLSKTININDSGSYYNILLIKENIVACTSYSANRLKFYDIDKSNVIKDISNIVVGWTPNSMLKFNDNILLLGSYHKKTDGIYIIDLQKYEIITRVEGFNDVNTIIKYDEDSILVGGDYNNYSMDLYEFDEINNTLTLNSKKESIHSGYVYHIIKYNNDLISCSNEGNGNGIKYWSLIEEEKEEKKKKKKKKNKSKK